MLNINKVSFLKTTKNLLYALTRRLNVSGMANSRYEYVKTYEMDDKILPNVWIVVRIDGKSFHKFSKIHNFHKPNDIYALNLMNQSAIQVMEEFHDVILSYGQSDEYSFVFKKDTNIFKRRSAKLLSYVTSIFTSAFVYNWQSWFPEKKLEYPPCFDGRVIVYPSDQNLKDYLSWRQADVHINNLYNTVFWNLVLKSGLTNKEAEAELRGTFASDKNEILFSKFGINYNQEPQMFRKGTVLLRKNVNFEDGIGNKQVIVPLHEDMIKEKFWKKHTELLGTYLPNNHCFNGSNSKEKNNEKIDNEIPVLVTRQIKKITINGL